MDHAKLLRELPAGRRALYYARGLWNAFPARAGLLLSSALCFWSLAAWLPEIAPAWTTRHPGHPLIAALVAHLAMAMGLCVGMIHEAEHGWHPTPPPWAKLAIVSIPLFASFGLALFLRCNEPSPSPSPYAEGHGTAFFFLFAILAQAPLAALVVVVFARMRARRAGPSLASRLERAAQAIHAGAAALAISTDEAKADLEREVLGSHIGAGTPNASAPTRRL